MIIPNTFKSKIKDTFYDKTVTLYTTSETKDAAGWSRMSETESSTFLGNVSFSRLAKIQEDYGLEDSIDIAITTDENVSVNSVIGYGSKKYKITGAIPFDSHYLLTGNEWLSKSSTSPSV